MKDQDLRSFFARIAPWLRRAAIWCSIVVGAVVGLTLGGSGWFWGYAFGGFISLLHVGMAAVLAAVGGEAVAPGDWRAGLALSTEIFLSQTTAYALMLLGTGVIVTAPAGIADFDPARLALQMLPGLYICTVMAIVLSGPLYLRWLPVRRDR